MFINTGTDEQAIISLLAARSNEQRQEIRKKFKLMYGKVSCQVEYSHTRALVIILSIFRTLSRSSSQSCLVILRSVCLLYWSLRQSMMQSVSDVQ